MIKIFLFATLLLISFAGIAQKIASPILLQMRDGKIYFDNVYALDASIKKAELYTKAVSWFNEKSRTVVDADERAGKIAGTYNTRVDIGSTGTFYLVKASISIIVYDATYEVKIYDIYEKPVKKGVSNEYSKAEYRWWDFRRGKPWSADDEPLFRGISEDVLELINSLNNKMNK
jgi:hypothetical protein